MSLVVENCKYQQEEVNYVLVKVFDSRIKQLSDDVEFHYINIKEFDKGLIDYINENFVRICKGKNNKSSLDIIKKRAANFFEKKDQRTRNGATAEFFLHLYLRSIDYQQECMFLNMEETSIKKGFDGYYSKENEEWILESKSGNSKTKGISHSSKISEAYASLKKQLSGDSENDPWQNAYQHANSRDVDTSESIVSILQGFSDDFISEKFYSTENFNILPAATVFLNGEWKEFDFAELTQKVKNTVKNFECKKLMIICCTKKSLELFMDFLCVSIREDNNESNGKDAINISE